MGTLSLECPFCCTETFSSRDLLKDHILQTLNNISCSICNTTFDNVSELTEHLDTECESPVNVNINIKREISEENEEANHSRDDNENDLIEEEEETGESLEKDDGENDTTNDDGVTYMCIVCNVQFKSIEDHLDKYHDGEEVLLETEEPENELESAETEEPEFVSNDENFEISNDPIDNDQLNRAEDEHQYLENEENKTTKPKSWASRKVGLAPLTENYAIENGKVKKITEEEAAEISDRNSIIQIHQCPKCFLQFPKLDHYIKHACNQKKSEKKIKCIHCSTIFQNHQSLTAHMKSHLKDQPADTNNKVITLGPHTCDLCNTMFPSFKSLRLHKRMHDPQKTKPIESPVSLKSGDDKVRQMFICHICNNTYDIEYEEVHMKSHSEEDNFYCATCNRKFLTNENLEMHMKAHTNTKKFTCSYCKKAFTNNEALTEHINHQCHKRSYECQYCGRRFSRPCEKVKHERIHTGEKPHICQICGKAFRVSYCLTLHMRTHSGSRPYECQHCNKRFKSHSVYNHHLLIHSDVRAYKCPYCPKAFKTSVQLAGHKNSHIKPFNCTECNRPFASLYAVRAHMETHKRENNLKFDCWLCGATYARAFALKDHMKSQHSGDNINEEEKVMESSETDGIDLENYATEENVSTEEMQHEEIN